MSRTKPYSLTGEPSAENVELTDRMFEDLYSDVAVAGSHTLLSTSVTDTLPANPVRGDMIVANATPVWARFPMGVNGTFLKSGPNDPLWASILETDITDGTILARVASNETITGIWTFSTSPRLANGVALQGVRNPNTLRSNLIQINSLNQIEIGDSTSNLNDDIQFWIQGTNLASFKPFQFQLAEGLELTKTVGKTLGAGNNNNLSISSNDLILRVTGNATTSVITGISGPTAGRILYLFNVSTDTWNVTNEDTNSTNSNRIITPTQQTLKIPAQSGVFLWYDSTTSRWRVWSYQPIIYPLSVYKTADESVTSSTVLQDDNELTLPVLVSSIYRFSFKLFATNVSGAEGIKVALGGTATSITTMGQVKIYDGTTLLANTRVTALGSSVAATPAADSYIEIDGTINVSGSGTFLLQFAQNTSGANAVKVQQGSSLVLERIT